MNNSPIRKEITYSDKEKMILLLPMKTGTMHAAFMFNHFDFITETYEFETGKVVKKSDLVTHHHCMSIPQKYEDYSIICTARNPYTRLISAWNMSMNGTHDESKHISFKNYFSKTINNHLQAANGFPFGEDEFLLNTTPKYFLRVESLYHDYIQIPFIKNSKLNKSGVLYELCNKKIHSTGDKKRPLKEYYTEDMADYMYDKFKYYFDIIGYSKDSWKYE
jgi:hypothetical protein